MQSTYQYIYNNSFNVILEIQFWMFSPVLKQTLETVRVVASSVYTYF